MTRVEIHHDLQDPALAEIRALLAATAFPDGEPQLGEQKRAQLHAGARRWSGVFVREDGRLVGYAHLRWNDPGDEPRVTAELLVRPDAGGGVENALLARTRTAVADAGGGLLYLWGHRVDDADAFARRLGMDVQRELAVMTRPLSSEPGEPDLPDGVTVRGYRPGIDDEAFLEVNNAAFAGHPENGGWDLDEFARRREHDWFDPAGLLLAWRGSELLGFHWTKRHPPEAPGEAEVGEVYVLGVHPGAQGLGLGRALLDAGLAHLYDRGCRSVVLYVDMAAQGAVRLYERGGFRTAFLEVCLEERIPPKASSPVRAPAPEGSSL